ncbi:MAG: hypothetical protein ACPG5P_04175, partial [Saprospiraceae bacterium]
MKRMILTFILRCIKVKKSKLLTKAVNLLLKNWKVIHLGFTFVAKLKFQMKAIQTLSIILLLVAGLST